MPAPKVIGPYEIGDLLGRGGMGEVYRAADTRMYRRSVALKLLSEAMGADPRALSKFDQEIETAANLRHPNIVQIYDRGEYEGRRYFAMELLEGRDLTDVIKERDRRPLDARLEIIVQLCDALDYAHANGVVHRDIKPANIIVITSGGTDHVKLVDFGIAHVAKGEGTRTVVQPGTTLYMSPEQLKDEMVSPRSDLFSLGIVAYELCVGVHPFRGRTEYLTSTNIMFEKHAPLRSLEPSAPADLEALIDRLLEKDIESRPAAAAEVAAELKTIIRQLRAESSNSEAPSFGNLDEMTGLMVERIVHWAKGKEAAGASVEALEAYKRATLLAPNVPWLQSRIARLEEQLKETPALAVPQEHDPGGRTSSRNRHRVAFVQEQMIEAGAALDEGELDRASSIAAVILRQYPDEPQALALMDRIVLITDRGLAVKPYRQALRAAREALSRGDIPSAQRSCGVAVAIWPDDLEVITLGQEIESVCHVERLKALALCDDVLERASAGTLAEDATPTEVARAREALHRAEEMGAPASLVGGKTAALDRLLSDALARTEERGRKAREVEEARRAEVERLLVDAGRRLSAAERAASADAASARAALADARAAQDAIARAETLGAGPVETDQLRVRLGAAERSLEDQIASEEARDRDIATRLDAVRAGLAEAERLAAGEADDALRAGELMVAVESDLAEVEKGRPSVKELPGLRSAAAALKDRLAGRRREEQERRAREARDLLEREAKEQLERQEQARAVQLAAEARVTQERAEREKAAAQQERLRALLDEARAAFREADDLAASIETEADLMVQPLAAARRAVEAMLEIEPADADAKALFPKIEKLASAAGKRADAAARLRREAAQREIDREIERKAKIRAARKKWILMSGGVIVVIAMLVGGISAFKEAQRRKAAAEEAGRLDRVLKAKDEVAQQLTRAGKDVEELRGTIGAIDTVAARARALARCDDVSRAIERVGQLDASNPEVGKARADLSGIRKDIENVSIGPEPSPIDQDLETRLATIRGDLDFAGQAPVDAVEKINEAIERADHGIGLAMELQKNSPSEGRTQRLLRELQRTQSVLLKRQTKLLADAGKKQTLVTPPDVISNVVVPVPEKEVPQKDAAPDSGNSKVIPQDTRDAQLKVEVASLLGDAKQQSLSTPGGVAHRIELDRQGLARLKGLNGQDWAKGASAELQSDLDTALVWSLFHKYRSALVARSKAAILEQYPRYPSLDAIADMKQFDYDFEIVDVTLGAKSARVRETTRSHFLSYADKPTTSTRTYTLDRRSDGSWFIVSATLDR